MAIAFPPQPSEQSHGLWLRCKMFYPTRVVILLEEGYGFTLSSDALTLTLIINCPLYEQHGFQICYFPIAHLNTVLSMASRVGVDLVVCDPPEDPTCHLFN